MVIKNSRLITMSMIESSFAPKGEVLLVNLATAPSHQSMVIPIW